MTVPTFLPWSDTETFPISLALWAQLRSGNWISETEQSFISTFPVPRLQLGVCMTKNTSIWKNEPTLKNSPMYSTSWIWWKHHSGRPTNDVQVFIGERGSSTEERMSKCFSRRRRRDFPGGPVDKHSPYNAGDMGLIPGWEIKIPQAVEQLSRH